MLQNKDTVNVPTLFFANKIDISDHLTPVECVQVCVCVCVCVGTN